MYTADPAELEDDDDDDSDEALMTDWERSFLADVGSQTYPLTDRQEYKVAEIAAAIEERRDALAERRAARRQRRR